LETLKKNFFFLKPALNPPKNRFFTTLQPFA